MIPEEEFKRLEKNNKKYKYYNNNKIHRERLVEVS